MQVLQQTEPFVPQRIALRRKYGITKDPIGRRNRRRSFVKGTLITIAFVTLIAVSGGITDPASEPVFITNPKTEVTYAL